MHLWPSMKIRESFKHGYLKKLEWNLHRMKVEKQQSPRANQEQLLDNNQERDVAVVPKSGSNRYAGAIFSAFGDLIMLLSCCYCCFCCGACTDEEDS